MNPGERALEIAKTLAKDIGPRPVGSEGEARALDYAENFLRRLGLTVERQPVPEVPPPVKAWPLQLLGLALLVLGAWGVRFWTGAVWLPVLYMLALPPLFKRLHRRFARHKVTGYNLIARHPDAGDKTPVVLCAHIDTARASRFLGELPARISNLTLRALPGLLVAIAALSAFDRQRLNAAEGAIWDAAWLLVLALTCLVAAYRAAYAILSRGGDFSPGANDNASGVAAVLTLAERLTAEPLRNLNPVYVLSTGEESGLYGSEHFAKQWQGDARSVWAVNFDMVGAGDKPYYVRAKLPVPLRFTDRRLNRLLRKANPRIRGKVYLMGNSDFYPLLKRGFRATSVGVGGQKAWVFYHTEADVPEHLSPKPLAETVATVEKALRLLDGSEKTSGGA